MCVLAMLKNEENNGTEGTGLVTPPPLSKYESKNEKKTQKCY